MRFKFYLRLTCAVLLADGYLACGGRSALDFESSTGGMANQGGAVSAGGAGTQGGHELSRGGASPTVGGREPGSGGASSSGGSRTLGGQAGMTSAATGGTTNATGGVFAAGGANGGVIASGGSTLGGVPGCDVSVVAGDSVQKAIDAAPVPGVVCVEPATYHEELTLRGGVSVFGSAPGVTLCGSVNANASDQEMVELSGFALVGQIHAQNRVQLNLHDLSLNLPHADCSQGLNALSVLQEGGGMRLRVNHVQLSSPGIVLNLKVTDVPLLDYIAITQSRCDDDFQCFDFLQLNVMTSGPATLPPGSALVVDIANNLVRNTVLEAMEFSLGVALNEYAETDVNFVVRHNTITSRGDNNYGIAFWTEPHLPVIVANNAIAYLTHPINVAPNIGGMVSPLVYSTDNVISSDASAKSWFADFDGGNFAPSANSPLIGAGSYGWSVPVDIDDKPRVQRWDAGAYQYEP